MVYIQKSKQLELNANCLFVKGSELKKVVVEHLSQPEN